MRALVGVAGGLLLAWTALLLALWRTRPREHLLQEAVRLLPDVMRLVIRLTLDRELPFGARVRWALLVGYLALPFDLVPDFLPVIGYLDDAVIVVWGLRSIAHRVGRQALVRHWPGTSSGLDVVEHLAGLRQAEDSCDGSG